MTDDERVVRDAEIAYVEAVRAEQHLRTRGYPIKDPTRVDRTRARYWAAKRATVEKEVGS